jgi:S-DNA-T family DNA segregation ATPase FtsK/SpoIIIE
VKATSSERRSQGVGVGIQPLATRLVAPQDPPVELWDPVTATALHRFIQAHSAITEAPITIGLPRNATLTIDGDSGEARGLLRAMICQLAVLHPPDQLLIVGVIAERNRCHWDWLKWLPHNQHPAAADAVGSARMVYRSPVEAQNALAGTAVVRVVVISDLDERAAPRVIAGATILEVGTGDGAQLTITQAGETQALAYPDHMDDMDALICARRLAAYRVCAAASHRDDGPGWAGLIGLSDLSRFDPVTLWRSQDHHDRLSVPIGTTVDGTPLELDIKEPAENGMGPHGLCIGATGSGKSELLRTVALGMMVRNSPAVLNLLLVDFKGGATFLDTKSQALHAMMSECAQRYTPASLWIRLAKASVLPASSETAGRSQTNSAGALRKPLTTTIFPRSQVSGALASRRCSMR